MYTEKQRVSEKIRQSVTIPDGDTEKAVTDCSKNPSPIRHQSMKSVTDPSPDPQKSAKEAFLKRLWLVSGTYFLQAQDSGLIKIGKAVEVARRIETVQRETPTTLTLLGWIPYRTEQLSSEHPYSPKLSETFVHRRFASSRVYGEWFSPDDAIIEFLAMYGTPVNSEVRSLLRELRAWRKAEKARWRN